MQNQHFSHCGDYGDIIYGLPTIRASGGGILYITDIPGRTLHGMSSARANSIIPLLKMQKYLVDVEYLGRDYSKDDNFSNFRNFRIGARNLADTYLDIYQLPITERNTKWITVDRAEKVSPVVINRSYRYRNYGFPWAKILNKYENKIVFVGMPWEYDNFCSEFGFVKYYPTDNLLDCARVIAGSELFVGNQSCPLAIAEGMKVNLVCEIYSRVPDCCFERVGRINAWDDRIELPSI